MSSTRHRAGRILIGLSVVAVILVVILVLTTCDLFSPAELEEILQDNPLDPDSAEYIGVVSTDADGDGVGDYEDVDEIVLVSPQNGTTIDDITPELTVGLKSDALGCSYCFAVSAHPDLSNPIILVTDSTTNRYAIGAGLLANYSTYYWRGGVLDAAGTEHWGETWSFSTIDISTVVPLGPADNAAISDTTPTLSWQTNPVAVQYHLQLDDNDDLSIPLLDKPAITTASYTLSGIGPELLSHGSSYYWRVRTKNADDQYGVWSEVWTFEIVYLFGDAGPAGGLVFYDKGSYTDGWRFLEAAPSDQSFGLKWGGYGTLIGGTSIAVGTGSANTDVIVNALGSGSYAARICRDLSLGGYDDWFLPSKDELHLMYENLGTSGIGGVVPTAVYWSSSEKDAFVAYGQDLIAGNEVSSSKDHTYTGVRPIRAF